MSTHIKSLVEISSELKKRKKYPDNIEIVKFGNLNVCNIYNTKSTDIVSSEVCTGIDKNLDIATLKAFVEYIERLAYTENFKNNIAVSLECSTDGFAAYPINVEVNSRNLVRINALAEAIERYVWSYWWDNLTVAQIKEYKIISNEDSFSDFIKILNNNSNLEKIYIISPDHIGFSEYKTVIIFAKLLSGGYISGGASSLNEETAMSRAFSELIRHSIGYKRFKENNLEAISFYEKRLIFFAEGCGSVLVENRLFNKSNKIITLPKLKFDTLVTHQFDSVVYVHRCLFENQLPFVGGHLERLCL